MRTKEKLEKRILSLKPSRRNLLPGNYQTTLLFNGKYCSDAEVDHYISNDNSGINTL